MKRIGQFIVVVFGLLIFGLGFHWLTDSYTATRQRHRMQSTYSRSFWFPYREGMRLADLRREHPELFEEALDHKIRLVRTDQSVAAHARNRLSQAASALRGRIGANYFLNLAVEANPQPIGIDYSLNTENVSSLLLRPDDSFIIWTSTLPIYIELYSK